MGDFINATAVATVDGPRRHWPVIAAALIGVPLLYVATFGPALGLAERGYLPVDTVALAYDPCLRLDAQAPEVVRTSVLACARLCGGANALNHARNRLVWRRYPVEDLAYRMEDGRRVFCMQQWLPDWFTERVMDEVVWKELGGTATVRVDAETKSLIVSQSLRGHVEVAAELSRLREKKRSLSPGRDLDIFKLNRAVHGYRVDESELLPGTILIRNPDGRDGPLLVDGDSFADIHELVDRLKRRPRSQLRCGVCWYEGVFHPPSREQLEALNEFCRSNDVDLLVRPPGQNVIGQPLPENCWVVRASDSIYLDAD